MRDDFQDRFDRARTYASDAAGAAADRLREGQAAAREQIAAAREQAAETYARSREKAGEVLSDARDTSYRAAGSVNRFVAEHPVATAAAAIAAGALVAFLIPRSRSAAKSLVKSTPKAASTFSARALAAAQTAGTAVKDSEFVETMRKQAAVAATQAREAIIAADIPATVKARAAEAAEAAREAIERARLPERAASLAGTAASKTADGLIMAGKALNDRLDRK